MSKKPPEPPKPKHPVLEDVVEPLDDEPCACPGCAATPPRPCWRAASL